MGGRASMKFGRVLLAMGALAVSLVGCSPSESPRAAAGDLGQAPASSSAPAQAATPIAESGPVGTPTQENPIMSTPIETATFAAGCFWGPELRYAEMPGVIDAEVGYAGGHVSNPTYKQVCTDTTGHAEVVRIRFDPTKITYRQLVDAFFAMHDPTQLNRQGPDIGSQYRSAVFYHSPEQKAIVESKIAELSKSSRRPIVTQVVEASSYYKAEEYHQDYLAKRGMKACGTGG